MKLRIGKYELWIRGCDIAALALALLVTADSLLTLGLISNGLAKEAAWISAFLLKKGGSKYFFFGRVMLVVYFLTWLTIARTTGKTTEKRCLFYCKLAFFGYIILYVVGTAWANNFFNLFS